VSLEVKLGVRVQIHSFLSSPIYSASVRGSLFKRLFHSVLLNVWLTLAALRIFNLAASHPQDATVLSLTSSPSATFRGSPRATAPVPSSPTAVASRLS
jgi:hypothetical protein